MIFKGEEHQVTPKEILLSCDYLLPLTGDFMKL